MITGLWHFFPKQVNTLDSYLRFGKIPELPEDADSGHDLASQFLELIRHIYAESLHLVLGHNFVASLPDRSCHVKWLFFHVLL